MPGPESSESRHPAEASDTAGRTFLWFDLPAPPSVLFRDRPDESCQSTSRWFRTTPGGIVPDPFVNGTDVQYLIGLGVAHPDRLIDMA